MQAKAGFQAYRASLGLSGSCLGPAGHDSNDVVPVQRRVAVALAGFSNTDIGELLSPPLTLIRQPAREMGEAAADLLLQIVNSKRPIKQFEKRMLTPQLQVRESSVWAKVNAAPAS